MIRSAIVAVVRRRPEVLADALDEVGPAGASGVDRTLGVGADRSAPAVGDLLEIAAGAADRAAGADAGDEVRDLAVGLLPDLRAGLLVVAERVVRVGVLVGLPGPVDLADEPVGDVVVAVGVLGRDGGRADHHLGAVRLEHVALVFADLVGADEHAVVALRLRDHRQSDAGVARRRLDDRAAGLELAALLGCLDHPQRDPVFDRAAWVEVLDLREHQAVRAVGRAAEAAAAACCRPGRAAIRRSPRDHPNGALWPLNRRCRPVLRTGVWPLPKLDVPPFSRRDQRRARRSTSTNGDRR